MITWKGIPLFGFFLNYFIVHLPVLLHLGWVLLLPESCDDNLNVTYMLNFFICFCSFKYLCLVILELFRVLLMVCMVHHRASFFFHSLKGGFFFHPEWWTNCFPYCYQLLIAFVALL